MVNPPQMHTYGPFITKLATYILLVDINCIYSTYILYDIIIVLLFAFFACLIPIDLYERSMFSQSGKFGQHDKLVQNGKSI